MEVDLYDVEENTLRAVVLRGPECAREGDATTWDDGSWAHTQKWAQRREPRHGNLHLLQSCQTNEAKGYSATNQDVVQPGVGNGWGDNQ
jgi:hypothetical protein